MKAIETQNTKKKPIEVKRKGTVSEIIYESKKQEEKTEEPNKQEIDEEININESIKKKGKAKEKQTTLPRSVQRIEDFLIRKEQGLVHVVLPLGFVSQRFTPAQRGFSIFEKELIAILKCFNKFGDILERDQMVFLLTDSQALLWSFRFLRTGLLKIQRYILKLTQFPFKILCCHVSGSFNATADALSRAWVSTKHVHANQDSLTRGHDAMIIETPFKAGQIICLGELIQALEENPDIVRAKMTTEETQIKETQISEIHIEDKIITEHQEQPTIFPQGSVAEIYNLQMAKLHPLFELINTLKDTLSVENVIKEQRSGEFRDIYNDLLTGGKKNNWTLEKGLLLYIANPNQPRIVLTLSLQSVAMGLFHAYSHQGASRLVKQLRETYYFINMMAKALVFTAACHKCAEFKSPNYSYVLGVQPYPTAKNHQWSLDIVEGYPPVQTQTSFLSLMDCHTGFRLAIPYKEVPTAQKTIRILEYSLLQQFGLPRLLISDRGSTLLKSVEVSDFLKTYGIRIHLTSSNVSWTHGKIESANKYTEILVNILVKTYSITWVQALTVAVLGLNICPGYKGQMTPFEKQHGFKFDLQIDHHLPSFIQNNINLKQIFDMTAKKTRQIARIDYKEREKHFREKGGKQIAFPPGTLVRIRDWRKKDQKKTRQKYYTQAMLVVQEMDFSVTATDYLGRAYYLHKSELKKFEETPDFQNLPLTIQAWLGPEFSAKKMRKIIEGKEEALEFLKKEPIEFSDRGYEPLPHIDQEYSVDDTTDIDMEEIGEAEQMYLVDQGRLHAREIAELHPRYDDDQEELARKKDQRIRQRTENLRNITGGKPVIETILKQQKKVTFEEQET